MSGPFLQQPPLRVSGGWSAKVGVNVDTLGREETVEEMEHLRFADLDAWKAYQAAVIERTNGVLGGMTEDLLS